MEDPGFLETAKLFTQKYCENLARQKQAMEGRQARQAAGLLALLRKKSN
jgi:hypothetical protein